MQWLRSQILGKTTTEDLDENWHLMEDDDDAKKTLEESCDFIEIKCPPDFVHMSPGQLNLQEFRELLDKDERGKFDAIYAPILQSNRFVYLDETTLPKTKTSSQGYLYESNPYSCCPPSRRTLFTFFQNRQNIRENEKKQRYYRDFLNSFSFYLYTNKYATRPLPSKQSKANRNKSVNSKQFSRSDRPHFSRR